MTNHFRACTSDPGSDAQFCCLNCRRHLEAHIGEQKACPVAPRCACAAEGGCHCLDYEPHEHCTCSPCEATIAPARAAALALSAQAGEEAHNRERVRWGLAPVVTA